MTAIACFTFDNMGEAADIGAGRPPTLGKKHPSIAVGYPNLFTVLARRDIKATFFVEGWNGEHNPDAVFDIVRRGHELGMHGWAHEPWSTLAPAEEERLARRATEILERATGVRPRGFRAPGGTRSAHSEEILRGLGYRYDASLGDDMRPTRLPSGLAQVPFVWPGVDGYHYLRQPPATPVDVRDTWLGELEKAAERDGLFVLVCHAFLTGIDPVRLAALEAVMIAASTDHRVQIMTLGDAAATLV